MSIEILIADDHHIFREGLAKIIDCDDSFEIIAEAKNGLQALEKIKKLKPDLAILDVSMPTMNGLEVAKIIQKENIKVNIVILSMFGGKKYYQEAMDSGVRGYVLKENTAQDLITALKDVSAGKYFISPLLSECQAESDREKQSFLENYSIDNLSPAEKRILKLISENKTSKEIGDLLCISYRTVQNHRVHVCTKLHLEGTNALLQFAIENKSNF